jgi:hypothetical protein
MGIDTLLERDKKQISQKRFLAVRGKVFTGKTESEYSFEE